MLPLVFFACVVMAAMVTLFLRLAPSPRRQRPPDRRPRIPAPRLRAVVIDLLGRLGLDVVEEELREPARRLVAVRDGEPEARCVVFVEPSPPGDVVPPPLLDELAESVRASDRTVGLLVTPYRIPAQPLDAPVELVDGTRLRQLVAAYLPERLAELDGYFGFTVPSVG
jgi:hypothetical protein